MEHLRYECQALLDELKVSQQLLQQQLPWKDDKSIKQRDATLHLDAASVSYDPIQSYNLNRNNNNKKKILSSKFGRDITGLVNVAGDAFTDLKPTYARSKLLSAVKPKCGGIEMNETDFIQTSDSVCSSREKENTVGRSCDKMYVEETDEPSKFMCSSDSDKADNLESLRNNYLSSIEDNQTSLKSSDAVTSSTWQPATPNTQRRRQLIDRHTTVPTKLDAKELRDLDNERRLNFSYSHIDVDSGVTCLQSQDNDEDGNKTLSLGTESTMFGKTNFTHVPYNKSTDKVLHKMDSQKYEDQRSFQKQLQDEGNNKKLNGIIREATCKPKSILNSSSYYSLNSSKRNNSRVRFNSSRSAGTPSPLPDHRLLGYDWIAALLDNDPTLIDQSESYFDELKDFRRAHKDECSNQFYMEGPHTLVDSEPEPVVEALTEPKVRPYIVNKRLFTEPFKTGLIDYSEDDTVQPRETKDPTRDNPRFVRVSIPRSTLLTPHRVKPHRRRSFDAADSCGLMDHCLLGWENTRPAVLPSAKTLDLNSEAGTRIDSETTTLAEAERLATLHNRAQWPFARPSVRLATFPKWQKHYMDTTLNLSVPSMSGGNSLSDTQGAAGREGVKRSTDRLLRSTYSAMYEMERLRQERELERKMTEERK